MKKILFASATMLSLTLLSCNDKKETTATVTDSSVTLKERNNQVYRAMETGDVSKLREFIADDAVDHNGGPNGEDIRGGDSIVAMLGQIHKSFLPGMKVNIIAQAVDGDYLFTLSEMVGTTTANPGMGMPPNMQMNSRSVDLVKIKDGKATDHWMFMSMADMMKMMSMGKEGSASGHEGMMHPVPADTMKK